MQKINFQHWIATSSAWSSDVKVHSSLCSLRCRSYNRNKANFTKNYVKVCRAGDLKRRYNVRNTPTIYAFILAVDHNATADFLGKSVSSNWKTLAINPHRKVRLISTRTRIVRGDPRHLQRYRVRASVRTGQDRLSTTANIPTMKRAPLVREDTWVFGVPVRVSGSPTRRCAYCSTRLDTYIVQRPTFYHWRTPRPMARHVHS